MGDLPETGKWVRLEVPAASVDLKPGQKLNGWAFTQFGGTVHWDQAGIVTVAPLTEEQLASQNIWEQYQIEFNKPSVPEELKKIIQIKKEERSDEQTKKLLHYYLQNINPTAKSVFAPILEEPRSISKAAGWRKPIHPFLSGHGGASRTQTGVHPRKRRIHRKEGPRIASDTRVAGSSAKSISK